MKEMITDDNQLILQAQKGSMEAFEKLVYKYDRHVLNIAHSFRNNEDDAKDIYQEVFMRVYKGLQNFRFRSEFSTWLYRITTNVCITFQTRKKRHSHDSIDREIGFDESDSAKMSDMIAGDSSTDEDIFRSELAAQINTALDKLPPQQKMAFTLKYYDGYKIKEIAEMMNCAEGTIKRYLFTATNKMKFDLKNLIEK
ncbi:MAG: sigma-70 family RNA polymerase sigma factor [Melioribacteraceae bacterium]|nr:sigma-70 family RNA polymerase sigma factor [Melioribacteraceae bacterium]MCF8356793.1 sigma-70 family RNA polymerase sigma factor [Melioribacteraceae bacterium]MCF8396173.1 sigma-70 family RNA polymerase sigma factor [Melioribacteraceae bacterium]MCF8421130.1 sigma-70 family RNA polymerase sigma factor [Melioribacteraceae bacterium]